MNFSSNQIGLTQATVYDISAADLAGANSGQRPDLLAKAQAIFRTPDQKLYAANAARSQLVAASTPVTAETSPFTGVIRQKAGGVEFVQKMPWQIAPQLSTQRVLDNCKRIGDYAISNAASATVTQRNDASGPFSRNSLRFQTGRVPGQNATATKDIAFNLNNQPGLWLVCETNYKQTAAQIGMTLFASTATGLGSGTGRYTVANPIYSGAVGLQAIWLPKSSWSALDGSPSWSSDMLSYRARIDSSLSEPRDWSLNGIMVGPCERPSCIITFDDGWESSYTIAHQSAQKRSIPLTHYLIHNLLGVPNFITLAQAQEMRENGDYLGLHGAERWGDDISRIDGDVAGLKALGIDVSHAAYPEGAIGNGYSWKDTTAKLQSHGVKSARLVGGNSPVLRNVSGALTLTGYSLNSSTALAQAKSAVDTAIAAGGTAIFYGHKIGATADSLTWTTSDFNALLDYIAQKRLEGLMDVTTIDKWFDGE